MKRDNDLVRQILLDVEEQVDGRPKKYEFADGNLVLKRHIELLTEAGYLVEVGIGRSTQKHKVQLTWAGHDYLDAVRDEGIWQKTKAAVAETGGSATLEIVKSLAMGFLKSKIEKHTGITM